MSVQQEAILKYIQTNRKQFDVEKFWGKWYIVRTSRSLWRSRINPSITFTMLEPGNRTKLLEVVHYGSLAKPRQEMGIDQQDKKLPNLFHRHGRSGLSQFLRSQWVVLDHDASHRNWAVVYFYGGAFTPEGIDLYTCQPDLPAKHIDDIVRRLQANPDWKSYAEAMFTPPHEGG